MRFARVGTVRFLGVVLGIAAFFAIAKMIGLNGAALLASVRQHRSSSIGLAVLLFATNLVVNGFAYTHLLKAFGAATTESVLMLCAYGTSILAKYIPGSIWQIAGRALSFSRLQIPAKAIVWTSFLEQLISLVLCVFLGMFLRYPALWAWISGVLLLFCIFLSATLYVIGRFRPPLTFMIPLASRRHLLFSVLLYFSALTIFLLSYWILARDDPMISAVRFSGALLLGTSAGLIAIFIPGGLGVREGVTLALAQDMQSSEIAASLLLARGALLIAEVACCLLCVWRILALGRKR